LRRMVRRPRLRRSGRRAALKEQNGHKPQPYTTPPMSDQYRFSVQHKLGVDLLVCSWASS
jgi:hypothetical protein